MVFTKSKYYGDCEDFDRGTNPHFFVTNGPGLALFIVIILLLFVVTCSIVGWHLKNPHGPETLHKKEDEGENIGVAGSNPSTPAGNNNYYLSDPELNKN